MLKYAQLIFVKWYKFMSKTPQPTHKVIKVFLVVFILFSFYLGYEVFFPHSIPNQRAQLIIAKGDSLHKTARKLSSAQIISNPRLFVILARLMGKDTRITAGMYILTKPMSLMDLVNRLSNGKPDEISLTILEGWNFRQLRNYLASESQITHLTESMTESQIRERLKISAPSMEGLIYPSTYFVAPNQSDLEFMQNGYKLLQAKLAKTWQTKNERIAYKNSYELLILASLIQKETNDSADMTQISTVFNNRLRIKMRLQDDPAVFYGLGNRPTITRTDFAIDTPYNTYLHSGLPPTPICMPSQVALDAAAQPGVESTLLYFVAIGKGKTKFSSSFNEHSEAVNKYLKKTTTAKTAP